MRRYAGAGATTPESARRPDELELRENFVFLRLVNHGVLVESGAGRYWIDAAVVREFVARRRRWAIVSIAVVLSLFLAWVLLRLFSS